MKISEFLVQQSDEQHDILYKSLPDVNIRLFKHNIGYRELIISVVQHMEWALGNEYEDYPNGRGISGANVGVGLNIIGFKIQKEGQLPKCKRCMQLNKESGITFLINPHILTLSNETSTAESNCGSLILPEPIKVQRHTWAKVSFYDLRGKRRVFKFEKPYAFVTQHEVDHNNGVLITDRIKK